MENQEENSHKAALIEDLLAAPFIAAANANSKMAQEQVKFLMESCFETNGDTFSPKMISLSIKNTPSDGNQAESISFDLPLITVLPFNSLCVSDINVKFDMEITSLTSNPVSGDENNNKNNIQMRGGISSSNTDNSAVKRRSLSKMSVEIKGGSIPLPVGLTTLLNFYSKNIQLKS